MLQTKYANRVVLGVIAAIAVMALVIFLLGGRDNDAADDAPALTQPSETLTGPLDPCETDSSFLEPSAPLDDLIEDTSSMVVGQGDYHNDKTYEWTNYRDVVISVGAKVSEAGDGIYLNPRCSEAEDGNEIGFYIRSSRGLLTFSGERVGDCDTGANAAYANFIIPDRFLNDVIPSEYRDAASYGVMWADDILFDGQCGGATVNIRAVNIRTREFIGACDVEIVRNGDGQYSIAGISSSDVMISGELPEEERDRLVETTLEFITGTLEMTPVEGWEDAARAGAVVQKTERPYFGRFLDTKSQTAKITSYLTCKDTFAVSMPVTGYGFITVYFAPELELMGLTEPTLYGETEMNLTIYGYDPMHIQSQHEMKNTVPSDFLD